MSRPARVHEIDGRGVVLFLRDSRPVRAAHWLRDGTPPGYFKALAIVAILTFIAWSATWLLP